jgi:hypothetical protein
MFALLLAVYENIDALKAFIDAVNPFNKFVVTNELVLSGGAQDADIANEALVA